jgi:hypothetical protein
MLSSLPFSSACRQALVITYLALATVTACGKDAGSTTGPQNDLLGAFSLQSVEGDDPPVTVFDGKARMSDGSVVDLEVTVIDSEIDLDDDDAYFMALAMRVTVNGRTSSQTLSNEGTYERSGNRIEFASDDPDISDFTGTWARGRLTLRLDIVGSGDEYEYVYSKGT